jgi:dienelactone hydrolase
MRPEGRQSPQIPANAMRVKLKFTKCRHGAGSWDYLLRVTRRTALLTLLGGTAALSAPRFRVYARCLPDYLAALARDAYERRNAALAQVKTPAEVRARQEWARRTLWDLIGGQPERTPLATKQAGSFERTGYRVEKLSYESWQGLRIPANLYIPTASQGPFPGVLFQMGHSLNGKAADTYQKCCQGLARLGYVVLAFDPMGQGERTYLRVGDADEEHSRPGRQMLLVGDTATRLQLWDAVRSLDVLAAQPMVDVKRLASMGQSGGATLTMLLAAVDDRLSCAVVSSGNTENFACAGFNPPGSTDDAEQDLIGSGPLGFDRWDLLYPMAPKPLLIIVSERDSFGTYSPSYIQSGEEEFDKLRRMYDLLGARDRIEWKTTGLPHALTHQMRLYSYEFLERWLKGANHAAGEPEVTPEPDEQLLAGVQSARVPLGAPTPGPIDSATLRRLVRLESEASVSSVSSVSSVPVPRAVPRVNRIMSDHAEGCEVETFEVESAPGVFLAAYLFSPGSSNKPVLRPQSAVPPLLLMLDEAGRTHSWREGGLYHKLAAAGSIVCAFDVRGIGDLTPEVGRGNPAYTGPHAVEEAYAWASLILGHPLLGQRVEDILAMARAVQDWRGHGRRLVLCANGHMTIPALCATALDANIHMAYLAHGLVSWSSLLEGDSYSEPFSSFLPGVLTQTDLPFVARLAQGRAVVLAGAVNSRGEAVPAADVRALYGAGVEVRSNPAWDLKTFMAL